MNKERNKKNRELCGLSESENKESSQEEEKKWKMILLAFFFLAFLGFPDNIFCFVSISIIFIRLFKNTRKK